MIRVAAVLLIALAALACKRENAVTGTAATETIAPAQPKPEATGTGDLTQTVDIEGDNRSEAEGGVLTKPGATTETTATTATTTTSTATTATTTR